MVAVLIGERVDVHEDVVDGVLGLLVVHDVFLFAVIEGDILIAEVGADLGEQCGVERDGDGELGVGEHLPLNGRDLGIHAVTDLEGVDLGVAVGADGIGAVGVGVEAGDILAAGGEGTDHLEGVPVGLAGLEEQRLHLVDQGAGRGASIFTLVLHDLVVSAFSQRGHEVIATLDIARPLVHTGLADLLAVGFGDVELAVGVLGKALLLGHGLDALGMETVLGVIEVYVIGEVADVGVERGDVIGELHSNPLMAGKRGEQPGLGAVGDDDLVVGADALLVDQAADELDALAGRGTLAQDDAGIAVLANASLLGDGIGLFGLLVIGGAQRGRAGNALLVDASLGICVVAIFPLRGVVANEGVAVGCALGLVLKTGLDRGVLVAVLVCGLNAKVLDIARTEVLGTAVVRVAVCRKLAAHVDLGAGERRSRHGHDGRCSKRKAAAELFERVDRMSKPHDPSQPLKPRGTVQDFS